MTVIDRDEDHRDQHPGHDRPQDELRVRPVALGKPFAGSTEECGGADFSGQNGGQHSPPRNVAVT